MFKSALEPEINIDRAVLKGFPKETLEIMISRVGVKGLVEISPKCITVVNCDPIEQAQALQCSHKDCLTASCRKCQKPDHGDQTCEEAAKDIWCYHCLPSYPPLEIARCEAGYPFYLGSTRMFAANKLGSGVPVLAGTISNICSKIFTETEVLKFIDLNVFNGLPIATLEQMINRVGVKGLVKICPNYITVVKTGPVEEVINFLCTIPDCIAPSFTWRPILMEAVN